MRFLVPLSISTVLALGIFAPGCGCNPTPGELPPPPAGAKAEPWAEWQKDTQAGGKASFTLNFADVNGNIAAASKIYMNMRDPYGRSAHNVTVTTDKEGNALFEDIPVGNFMLEFHDQTGDRKSRLQVDLGKFTGDKAGGNAGTVNF